MALNRIFLYDRYEFIEWFTPTYRIVNRIPMDNSLVFQCIFPVWGYLKVFRMIFVERSSVDQVPSLMIQWRAGSSNKQIWLRANDQSLGINVICRNNQLTFMNMCFGCAMSLLQGSQFNAVAKFSVIDDVYKAVCCPLCELEFTEGAGLVACNNWSSLMSTGKDADAVSRRK